MHEIEVRTANLSSLKVGKLQAKYSVDGSRILRFYVDFWHKELDLHKELSAPEIYILQGKVDALIASWDKKLAEHRKRLAISSGKEAADQMTVEATNRLDALTNILQHTLKVDDRVNWETLKDRSGFNADGIFKEPLPERIDTPMPTYADPKFSILDIVFFRRGRKIAEAKRLYEKLLSDWQTEKQRNAKMYSIKLSNWQTRKVAFEADFQLRKRKFFEDQMHRNNKIDQIALGVSLGETQSVIEHANLVLEKSDYGDLFEKTFEVDYLPTEKTIMVEYELPAPASMPTLKSARFVPATGEIRETHISERDQKSNFDMVCYQICLRTIHELFEADEHKNIEKVLFNGFVTYIDRATGRDVNTCIMSVLVNRSDFASIDLRRVEPKACFKSLKGVSASSLAALAPIPPVMELNKEDRRFVDARNTANNLNEATNLAAMDWEDFEHLVREIFEKEFSKRGGEVKITRASSDGGVDAVAFDPDPITGGKIVIQAKRYTRTVGVSAVRDLFGTMQHESASRGILITTADYGPDAYQFASGKPITLFTGANLLHLLEQHGYKAKIDLNEARKELNLKIKQ